MPSQDRGQEDIEDNLISTDSEIRDNKKGNNRKLRVDILNRQQPSTQCCQFQTVQGISDILAYNFSYSSRRQIGETETRPCSNEMDADGIKK